MRAGMPQFPFDDSKRFSLTTLGCKVNQYESRALAEAWEKAGLSRVDDPAAADVAVLVTCAVTARAEAESRRLARQLARQINPQARPGARAVVTGCAAVVAPDAFAALGVIVVPDKAGLARRPFGPDDAAPRADAVFPDLAVTGYDRARGLVKIQDGCSHGCSYCIVPSGRGASVSRPFPDILAEAIRLITAGHREIGLTGINLGHYGRDLEAPASFWDLLAALDDALAPRYGDTVRLRLGSLDPAMLTEEGLSVLAAARLVCPHLHISLQSADPEVLVAMGRRADDANRVSSFVDAIRIKWPTFGLGCDVLTGFPGESDAAFGRTRDFLSGLPLTYAHVFPYSRRPGTRAAAMAGQLSKAVKTERARELRELAAAKKAAFRERLSREARVVVALERHDPAVGTCGQYVDCRFDAPVAAPLGALVRARPVGRDGDLLLVAPLEAGAGA
ncbi:RNA modification enzyme, MiaB family [Solidesulfovibrio fructosivorans JJ]]|uniref:RNA modification enzyme, MiaB family n=2 Tax=Solidesulfovibrio fructosivorans TaxID=878 RepID=E1JX50_SOLFR|nr:RNA modification enzyme, MiaB family [Solidesulfovibrio fructosivorans JJ]]